MSDEKFGDFKPEVKSYDSPELKEVVEESTSTKGSNTEDIKESLKGQVLADKYEILSAVGSGGLGIVYRAKHLIVDKIVAIKILIPGKHMDSNAVNRFRREAKAAMGLKHKNIAGVQDIGMHDGMSFIVMEFVEGSSLKQCLDANSLTAEEKLSVLIQLCHALEYARQKGIVHRDLKPENIIVSDSGGSLTVSVIDFGIAKLVDTKDDVTLTKTGDLFGTPQYMSPEQCMGETADHRSDIYAVGCIAYEMFTGKTPFVGASILAILNAHVAEEVPSMTPPTEFAGMKNVVLKCLAKDKSHRYETAGALLGDLETVLKGGKVEYKPQVAKSAVFKKIIKSVMVLLTGLMILVLAFTFAFKPDDFSTLSEKIRKNPQDVEALLARGAQYHFDRRYNSAISDYRKVLEVDPDNADAHIRLAQELAILNKYEESIKEATIGIKLRPKEHRVYLSRGVAYMYLGEHLKAIKDLEKSIELNPNNIVNNNSASYTNIADCYLELGKYDAAITAATKAIKLKPDFENPYCLRAAANFKLGNFDKCITDASDALKINPKIVEAYNLRGRSYLRAGKLDLAIRDFTDVIYIDSTNLEATFYRAVAYRQDQVFEKSVEDFDKAIAFLASANSSNPEISKELLLIERAKAKIGLKEYGKALEDLDKSIAIKSTDMAWSIRNDLVKQMNSAK